MKLNATIFLFVGLLFLVPSTTMAGEIAVTDADSVWMSDLIIASSDVTDSTDAPEKNLIKWAFVSHAETVWSASLEKEDFEAPPKPEKWSFAIITDLHIGGQCGWPCKLRYHSYDYGDSGWNDNATGQEFNQTTNKRFISTKYLRDVVNFINSNANLYNINFVVVTGDFSDSAEMSELNKAIEILDNELKIPWIPIIGNHDIWPYVSADEKAPEEISDKYFNDIFKPQYEKLRLSEIFQKWEKADTPIWNPEVNPQHSSYFQNFAFDYKGYHFTGLDFNARDDAPNGKGVAAEADLHDFSNGTWDWFTKHLMKYIEEHPESKESIILLAHHPFNKFWFPWLEGVQAGFSEDELDTISNFLINYKDKIYAEFAGHTHQTKDYQWHHEIMHIVETDANFKTPLARIIQVYPDRKIDFSKMLGNDILIKVASPVDLIIIDPDNLTISKELSEIQGVTYIELEENSTLHDLITIPERKLGDYQIKIIPEPGANPTDTYTLEVSILEDSFGYIPIVLAENAPISEVPTEPYIFTSKEKETTQLTYTGDLNGQYSDAINLSTILTDKNGNTLSNKTIIFEIGDQSVSTITNENGVAIASLILEQIPGKYYFIESTFIGDSDYLPSFTFNPFEILESAKWFKKDAIGELEAINTMNKHVQKDIEEAIESIERSLDEVLWIDASHLEFQHGHKVFDREKQAVKELLKIIKEIGMHTNIEITDDIQVIIDKIVRADELLAKVAIYDAKNTSVIDPDNQLKVDQEIAKAEEELAKAYQELEKDQPDKAIDHFKKAWEHAQLAIKFANLEKSNF